MSNIKFATVPVVKPLPKENMYVTLASINVVYVDDQGETRSVHIPEGYRTDGATIPKVFYSTIGTPFSPKFLRAAIVHDFMCNVYDGKISNIDRDQVTVDLMSDLFFDLLRLDGVSLPKALTMEAAVRLYKSLF